MLRWLGFLLLIMVKYKGSSGLFLLRLLAWCNSLSEVPRLRWQCGRAGVYCGEPSRPHPTGRGTPKKSKPSSEKGLFQKLLSPNAKKSPGLHILILGNGSL